MKKITRIEISFPAAIRPPGDFYQNLTTLIEGLLESSGKKMSISHAGGKLMSKPFLGESLELDDSVFQIEVELC